MDNNGKDPETGKFLAGNKLWQKRKRHGRKAKVENAEALKKSCCKYFDWVVSNPLYEDKVFWHKGKALHTQLEKMRPMTRSGLYIHLGICRTTWTNWRKKHNLCEVIEWVENVIYVHQLTGAAAGLLNANIISRELGLMSKEKTE